MNFIYYPSEKEVKQYFGSDEILMMLVSFDGETARIKNIKEPAGVFF